MKFPKRFLAGVVAMSLLFSNMSTIAYAVDEVPAVPEAVEAAPEAGPSAEELAAQAAAEQAAAEEAARQAAEQAAAEEAARQAAEQAAAEEAAAEEAARQAAEQAAAEEAARQAAEQAAAEEAARQAAEQAAAEEAARQAAEQAAAEEAARQAAEKAAAEKAAAEQAAAEEAAAEEPADAEEPEEQTAAPKAAMAAANAGLGLGIGGTAILPVPENEEVTEPEAEEPDEPAPMTVQANGVTVDAVLPAGTTVTVQAVDTGAAAAAIAALMPEGYAPANVKAWDIALTAGGETVQPDGDATVTLPAAPEQDAAVYYIHNGAATKVADLPAHQSTFTAKHFSTYAVAEQVKLELEDEDEGDPEGEPKDEPEYDIDTGLLTVPGMGDAEEAENGGDDAVVAAPEIMPVPEIGDETGDEAGTGEAELVTVTFKVAPLEGAEGEGWTLEKAYPAGATLTWDSPDLPAKDEFTDFPAELELGSWYLDEAMSNDKGLIDNPVEKLTEAMTLYARAIDPTSEYGVAPVNENKNIAVTVTISGLTDDAAVEAAWEYLADTYGLTTDSFTLNRVNLPEPNSDKDFTKNNDEGDAYAAFEAALDAQYPGLLQGAKGIFAVDTGTKLSVDVFWLLGYWRSWKAELVLHFEQPPYKFEITYDPAGGRLNGSMAPTTYIVKSYTEDRRELELTTDGLSAPNGFVFTKWQRQEGTETQTYDSNGKIWVNNGQEVKLTALWEPETKDDLISVRITTKEGKTTYRYGETINYIITVKNNILTLGTPSWSTMKSVKVNGTINDTIHSFTDHNPGQIQANKSVDLEYPYTVTAEDVARGYIGHTVTADQNGTLGNYHGEASLRVDVEKPNVTAIAGLSVPYDGAPCSFPGDFSDFASVTPGDIFTLDTAGITVTYTDDEGNQLEGAPTNAGDYKAIVTGLTVRAVKPVEGEEGRAISYTVNGDIGTSLTCPFTITPAGTVTIQAPSREIAYGEDPPLLEDLMAEVKVSADGEEIGNSAVRELRYGIDGTPMEADPEDLGTYSIIVILEDGAGSNYESVTVKNGELKITKKDIGTEGIDWPANDGCKYDGQEHSVVLDNIVYGKHTLAKGKDFTVVSTIFTPAGAAGSAIEYTGETFKDAGVYTITVEGTGNYCGTKTITYTIGQAPVTAALNETVESVYPYTYDGSSVPAASTLVDVKVNGTPVATDDEKLALYDIYYVNETDEKIAPPSDVGTYYIHVASKANDNYEFTPTSSKFNTPLNIVSQSVTENNIIVEGIKDVKYNGNEQKLGPASVKVDGQPVAYKLSYKNSRGDEDFKNSHDNQNEITVTVTLIGNYTGTKNITYTIRKRTIWLTAPGATKVYDGTPLTDDRVEETVDGTRDGFVDGETFTYKFFNSQMNVGSISNQFECLDGSALLENYDIGKTEGPLTVNPAPLTVRYKNKSATYGDVEDIMFKAGDITIEGIQNNEAISAELFTVNAPDGIFEGTLDVGTYTVTPAAVKPGEGLLKNYKVDSQAGTLEVTPATLTVTTASAAKTYDSTPLTAPRGTLTGMKNGDRATLVVDGFQVGVGQRVNGYHIEWDNPEKAKNYTIVENLGTLEVTAADETPVAPANAAEPPAPTEPEAPAAAVDVPAAPAPAATAAIAGRAGLTVPAGTTATGPDAGDAADADAADAADGDADAADAGGQGGVEIDEDETPLASAPAGEEEAGVTIEEDDTPLAGAPLDAAADCRELPHLMWSLLLLAAVTVATYANKRRQASRFSRRG